MKPVVEAVIKLELLRVASVEVEVVPKSSLPKTVASTKRDVDDAWRPLWNQIAVEVAFASAPKLIVGVQAKTPTSVPHERTPAVDAFTSQVAEVRLAIANDVVV